VNDLLVLCYHAVSDRWRSPLAVTTRSLEAQLGALVRRGYRGALFTEAVTTPTLGKTLVVTFDDAYRSIRELALPVLESLGLPATVFAPTNYLGGGQVATWPLMEHYVRSGGPEELTVMSWEQLAELQARGWEIGSHSLSHPDLTSLDDDSLVAELAESKRLCEERLSGPCRSIAFPFGSTDTRVMAATGAAGYEAAAGLPMRRFHVPLTLNWPRVGIYGSDPRWRFELKVSQLVRRIQTFPMLSTGLPEAHSVQQAGEPVHSADSARIAVIVPCFNDGKTIVDTIDSIDEPEPVEILVIDDASTDPATIKVLDTLRDRGINVIRHEVNLGLPPARMTGLRATSAPYVFPLDSDDLIKRGVLSAMADKLDAMPDAAACFGDYAMFGTYGGVRHVPNRLDPYRIAYRNDYPVASLFRRTVLESVGGWQQVGNEIGYEDWNLWMTLAERGEVGVHWGRGVSALRRLHGRRMLSDSTRRHIALYATLRTLHPRLYADLAEHRRRTNLGPVRRWLYPVVFGWRPPLSLWSRVLVLIERVRNLTGRSTGERPV
jgi:peptidoglycan/xylan/chitin deacetylase (PgdA/CDA1 family)/glycosyltransferase involved in cell wall biosynthesis